MHRTRLGIAALIACLIAVAGVAPALAGSSGNPQWSVEGTALKTGETKTITGEASGVQKLKSGEVTVACSALALESGSVIAGGSGSTSGTGTEQLVYSGCTIENTATEEPISGCKVNSSGSANGTVKTEQLKARLAYSSSSAAEHEEASTVTVLKPETGVNFLQLELSGENCPTPGNGKYGVEGELALHNPEGSTEKTKHTSEATATSIKTFYLNNGGLPKEEKVKGLKVVGIANAVYSGNAIFKTSPEAAWSAQH
jgi:hypothetical protein